MLIGNMNIQDLVGKKIVACKGLKDPDKRKTRQVIPLDYILLDDNETIISFDEQDYYSYHDCASSARHVHIRKDPVMWKFIMTDPVYANSMVNAHYPF